MNFDDWTSAFIVMAIVCGIVGWGVIELLFWLFGHISIAWM